MAMRGVRKPGARTMTSAVRGIFKADPRTRAEALSLILGRRLNAGDLAADRSRPDRRRRTASRPDRCVVGVLNVTPDSFSDGGRYLRPRRRASRTRGRCTTRAPTWSTSAASRPGPARSASTPEEEQPPGPAGDRARWPRAGISVSVDTYRAAVAAAALAAGARVVNDVSGGLARPGHGSGRPRRRLPVDPDALARAQRAHAAARRTTTTW